MNRSPRKTSRSCGLGRAGAINTGARGQAEQRPRSASSPAAQAESARLASKRSRRPAIACIGDLQAEKGEALARKLGAKVMFIEVDVRVEGRLWPQAVAAGSSAGDGSMLVNKRAIAACSDRLPRSRSRNMSTHAASSSAACSSACARRRGAMQPRGIGSSSTSPESRALPGLWAACLQRVQGRQWLRDEIGSAGARRVWNRVNAVCPATSRRRSTRRHRTSAGSSA